MRMVHYFLAAALLLVPALAWTLWTGLDHDASSAHFNAGLFTAVLAVAAHTLLILFMIVTGRVLKEAMRARSLGSEFLEELNRFFARKSAYPLAILASFSIVAAAVLGNARRGFGISETWHIAVGVGAALLNLWTLWHEFRALRENQKLIDRTALALDRLDREQGMRDQDTELAIPDPRQAMRWGCILAVSAWFPYLYWALVNWRGDFSRVSLHPWVEGSLLGVTIWWIARAEQKRGNSTT
jgi:hypothetical protein